MSLRDEVAKRVRVKLARAPRPSPLDAPVTADSFGGTRAMRSVPGIYSSRAPSRDPYMPGPHPFHTQPLLGHEDTGDAIPREQVLNRPETAHFVAFHPRQVSPLIHSENEYAGGYDQRVAFIRQTRPDQRPPITNETLINGKGDEAQVFQQIEQGQRRVRALLGLPNDRPGAALPVYFKSHRAAELMARAAGGRVETVAYDPRYLSSEITLSKSVHDVRRTPARIAELAGAPISPGQEEPFERYRDHRQAPQILASHPAFGEYITTVGAHGRLPDHGENRYGFLEAQLSHRGAEAWKAGLNYHGALNHFAQGQPHDPATGELVNHDDISRLGSTARELFEQFAADPHDHLARAVLADHLEEAGQHELSNVFRSSLPQRFSRRGEKTRLAKAVADRVQVKLARQPSQPATAESFGSLASMARTPAAHMTGPLAFTKGSSSKKDYFGIPTPVVDDTQTVRNSPSALHFVAHDPDQLSELKVVGGDTPYQGARTVLIHDRGIPAWSAPIKNVSDRSFGDDEDNPTIERINARQGHVRRMLGIPERADGHEPTVYFKSHRAAQIAALLTGGHVESAAFNPKQVAKFIRMTSMWHPTGYDAGAGPPVHFYDMRGGKSPLDYAALASRNVESANVINSHPVFGEYVTGPEALLEPNGSANAESLWLGRETHRIASLGSTSNLRLWQPTDDILRHYGHPPVHFDPSVLSGVGREIHAQFVANPGDHLARAVLADHLEEAGHHAFADAFRSTLPQQFSRRGDKLRLSAAVAERVRVKLAKKASQPMTADSFGSAWHMQRANGGHIVFRERDRPDVFLNRDGLVDSADSVRSSPHAVHFVAHHPDQLTPQMFDWHNDTKNVRLHSPAGPGGFSNLRVRDNAYASGETPDEDPPGQDVHRTIEDGQRRVRQLLGIQGDLPGRSPTVFFKSHRAAQLAAAATNGHVETMALKPHRIATDLIFTAKYGGPSVAHIGAGGMFDLRSTPSQDSEYARLMRPRLAHEGFSFAPHAIAKHPILGEYATAVGPLPLNNVSFVDEWNPHRSVMLEKNNWQPNAKVRQDYGDPPRRAQVATEEAAELVREHWALLMEHASHGHQIELGGMHVPTRQHIESLGPDAQHLFALQRDPAARLALSDMLEDAGHDEAAHFMRATVPVQYARKESDAASPSLHRVVAQYASQKLRYARGANPYRDGDRVDVVGIGGGNYRRESLSQPGMHEVDIFERGHMTHRATVSLDRITPKAGDTLRVGDRVHLHHPSGHRVDNWVYTLDDIGRHHYTISMLGEHLNDGQRNIEIPKSDALLRPAPPVEPPALALPHSNVTREHLRQWRISSGQSIEEDNTPAQPATTGPQWFTEPHDLRAGDVIRIFNADDGSPIAHAAAGGADSHDVHGYELINQHERDTPFAAGPSAAILPTVRTIPLGPRNLGRNPFNLDTRGRMFQVLRRSEGPRDRSYVDSYGHTFYHGDVLHIDGEPHTVVRNLTGPGQPGVELIRQSTGRERFLEGRQDASGAYRIFDEHVRRIGDGEQATPAAPQDSVQQTAPLRVTARRGATVPAFGASQVPPPLTVPLEIMLHDQHSTTTGPEQADKLRAIFEAIHGSPVDDETIMHILRVPRPFAGADPHHEIFHPKNIRLRVTIGNDSVHAHVDSRLRNYSFEAGTDFSGGKVYNATQFHDGWHRDVRVPGEPVKLISTPHILQNQARAAHELGVPELRVSAGMQNPLSPGGMTGGLVWPAYGYTAPLRSKYASQASKLDEATVIIKRNDPSRAHDSDFWLHDLLSSQEGRAWYTKSEPTQNRTYYPNVISGTMHFRTHPDSESHQLLSAHTAKVEANAARKTTPAPEA